MTGIRQFSVEYIGYYRYTWGKEIAFWSGASYERMKKLAIARGDVDFVAMIEARLNVFDELVAQC